MIVAITPDPEAFDPNAFDENERYGQVLCEIFRKLGKCGVIVVDCNDTLLKDTARKIEFLNTRYAKEIRILLEEILKSKNKRVFRVDGVPNVSTIDKCILVANKSRSKAVITRPSLKDDYFEKELETEVVTYSDYYKSRLFKKFNNFTEDQIHTDNITKDDFDAILEKFTYYSRKLVFYDKQIGSGDNIGGIKRGIEYIVDLWRHSSQTKENKYIDIYTCAKENISKSDDNAPFKDQIRLNNIKMSHIEDKIVSYLESKYGVKVSVNMKVDKENRFHARYLSNGEFHIQMERGFDFLRSGEEESELKLRSFPFTLSPGAEEYLGAYQMAPDAALTT